MSQAAAQFRLAQQNERDSRYNAELSILRGREARRKGEVDASRLRRGGRALLSGQRAAYAGQNVDLSSGTVGATRAGTLREIQGDIRAILNNADREARGHKFAAEAHMRAGELAKKAGIANGIAAGISEFGMIHNLIQQQKQAGKEPAVTTPEDGTALGGIDLSGIVTFFQNLFGGAQVP